jgi:hypothetical protein
MNRILADFESIIDHTVWRTNFLTQARKHEKLSSIAASLDERSWGPDDSVHLALVRAALAAGIDRLHSRYRDGKQFERFSK